MKKLSPPWVIFSLAFTLTHGIPSLIPLLPVIAKTFQVDNAAIMYAVAFYSLASVVASPILGYLIKRTSRSFVLYSTLILYFLSGIGVALSQSFNELLIFRMLFGVGSAGVNIFMLIYPAEYYEGEERAKIMGRTGAFLAFGLLLNPFLAGLIAQYSSWRMALIILQIPSLIPLVCFYFMEKSSSIPKISHTDYFVKLKNLLSRPEILMLMALAFLIHGLAMSASELFTLYMTDKFTLSTGTLGTLYATGTLGLVIGSGYLMPRVTASKNTFTYFFIGGIISLTYLIGILYLNHVYLIVILLFFYLLQAGVIQPFINYRIANHVPSEMLLTIMILLMLCTRLGHGVITFFTGTLVNEYGFNVTFISTAAAYAGMLSILLVYVKYFKKKT